MNSYRCVIYLLLAMQVVPYIVTHLIVSGFSFDSEEERRVILRFSIPFNIVLNTLAKLLIDTFDRRSIIKVVAQLVRLDCSYRDISRLAAMDLYEILFAAALAYIAGLVYFRSTENLRLAKRNGSALLLLGTLAAVPFLYSLRVSSTGIGFLELVEVNRKLSSLEVNPITGEEEEDTVSYVTFRNNGALTLEGETLYLSEDIDRLRQLRLENVTIAPGESYTYTMSSDKSLNIKKDGGSVVYLTDSGDHILDAVTVAPLKKEEAYRKNASGGWDVVWVGAEAEEETVVPVPEFSVPSGFYDEEFDLTITAQPGMKIYYTLDSSDPAPEPTRESTVKVESFLYSEPIHVYDRSEEPNVYRAIRNVKRDYLYKDPSTSTPVSKAFIVRAVAVDERGNTSDIVTVTYILNSKRYKDKKVVSLVSDPRGLFDEDYGIHVTGRAYDTWYLGQFGGLENLDWEKVEEIKPPSNIENYWMTGPAWERAANFQLFSSDGDLVVDQPVGIRVQGNVSRQSLAQKRFSIFSRNRYSGSSYFDVPIIGNRYQHALLLRSGSPYFISQQLAKGRTVETIDSEEVYVLLDGELWYHVYLYEKFNEKNLAEKYGLNKDNVIVVKNGELTSAANNGKKPYSDIDGYINKNNLSIDENYFEYSEIIDIQSYIEMVIFNTYLANSDYQERWNNMVWHVVIPENDGFGDGRWRWGLLDMDLLWEYLFTDGSIENAYEYNPFITATKYQITPVTEWPVYSALRKNARFGEQYVITAMDLINTVFTRENTTAVLDRLASKGNYDEYQEFFFNTETLVFT